MPLLAWEREVDEKSDSLTVHESCNSSSSDDVRDFFFPGSAIYLALVVFLATVFVGFFSLTGGATREALLALGVTQKDLELHTGVATLGD